MTRDDYDEFVTVLRAFAELKNRTLSAPQIELYWRAMSDWEIAAFRAASVRLLKTCKFFPTPCEFEELRQAKREQPGEAFERARKHAQSLPVSGGFLQELASGDAELDAAVHALGGYRVLANANDRDLHFLSARFAEHLETAREAFDTREALPELTFEKKPLRVDGGPRRLLEVTKQ